MSCSAAGATRLRKQYATPAGLAAPESELESVDCLVGVTSRFHSLTPIVAKEKRKLVLTPVNNTRCFKEFACNHNSVNNQPHRLVSKLAAIRHGGIMPT